MIDSPEPFDAVVPLRCGSGSDVVIYASGAQRFVFGQHRAVQARLQQLTSWIERVVRLRAGDDEALADDLFQEARLEIVRVDPSRLGPGEERWLKRRVAAAVKRLSRREMWFRNRIMGTRRGETSVCRSRTIAMN